MPTDLFDLHAHDLQRSEMPLAARMRPRTLDEFVGQEHILGPGKLLRRAIETDRLFSSILLWGPPGTGKTTLAMIIANTTRSHFETMSAVLAGVADIRRVVTEARERRGMHGQRTILLVDEIHRFNKAQQDALLPHVEDGTIILIGATTENPYFEVVGPLLSRSRVFQMRPLTEEQILLLLRRALTDVERGYGRRRILATEEALAHLAHISGGDARTALNALELAVESTPPDADGIVHLTLEVAQESIQRRAVRYDRAADEHYDTISAFIKSVRGSDPDAALYWLAKMLYAGEDPAICGPAGGPISPGVGDPLSGHCAQIQLGGSLLQRAGCGGKRGQGRSPRSPERCQPRRRGLGPRPGLQISPRFPRPLGGTAISAVGPQRNTFLPTQRPGI